MKDSENGTKIHEEIEAALEEVGKRFIETEEVTFKISLAHLDFLRNEFERTFSEVMEREKTSDKKPATIAYKSIKEKTPEEFNIWLIKMAIYHRVDEIVMDEFKRFNKK